MYNFPIGVMDASFRLPFAQALDAAVQIGAQGIQMYATHGDQSPEQLNAAQRRELLQMLRGQLELFLLELYTEGENPAEPSNRRQYKKECFSRLSDYMKAHLAERLTLAGLAAACSMSESSIKSLCREFCDCGPTDYLISLRVTAAKMLIRESTLNFTEIAERTGFGTLHYFSRVFKERTGMTPTDYAKAP